MIAIYLPEGHGPPLTKEDGVLQRQRMWMTGNPQFDLLYHLLILRRTLVLLPSPAMSTQAEEQRYGITAVEVLSATIPGSQMRLEDLTDLEESIEWTWIGTMIGYLGIHTCEALVYLWDPTLVIASGGFGIARDGQNRRGMIPIMTILNIDRAVPLLITTGTVGTRTIATDLQGGKTKIVNGIRVDLGQIGIGDLSSVILLLPLAQQTHGKLGRSVKRGNCGNGMQEGDRHTLRPRLVQTVGMTREHQ